MIKEIEKWQILNPIDQFKDVLVKHNIIKEKTVDVLIKQAKDDIMVAFNKAEKEQKPSIDELFTDVYHDVPVHLQEQKQKLEKLVSNYRAEFPLDGHYTQQ